MPVSLFFVLEVFPSPSGAELCKQLLIFPEFRSQESEDKKLSEYIIFYAVF